MNTPKQLVVLLEELRVLFTVVIYSLSLGFQSLVIHSSSTGFSSQITVKVHINLSRVHLPVQQSRSQDFFSNMQQHGDRLLSGSLQQHSDNSNKTQYSPSHTTNQQIVCAGSASLIPGSTNPEILLSAVLISPAVLALIIHVSAAPILLNIYRIAFNNFLRLPKTCQVAQVNL